ncbi:PCI domain-containing protein [Phellopilus nigrolimitatus]|nr:PCI domain-containing protein [Phellopilus nigrolimitatus]
MSTDDVEMKPVDENSKEKDTKDSKGTDKDKKGKDKKEEPAPPPPTPAQEIKTNVALIEKGVSMLEPRFTHRVLRSLTSLRKKLDDKVLREAIEDVYGVKDSPVKKSLLSYLPDPPPAPPESHTSMDIDSSALSGTAPQSQTQFQSQQQNKPATPLFDPLPESEVYLRLLLIYHLLAAPETRSTTFKLAHETVEKIQAWNRRSMDTLAARIWFTLGRAYELVGDLEGVRPLLLTAQKTASLRRDDECQAVLINLLLRNYLHYNLYDQADKLVAKTIFPTSAGNPQLARYHYYLGRIKAVQLNYSDAHTNLQQAIRRAPPPKTAPGFFQAVNKFFVVVELLMGDIPERGLFRHPVLQSALAGYFEIVKAVRTGSLAQFQETLKEYQAQFTADKTHTLIVRLRQNVIKTGVRRLSLSYSRISLRDICVKLHLDSEEDAEYIVGKAIRDGVIEGRVIHEKGWLECAGAKSGYGPDVAEAYQRRIGFCLTLHNESVKAMRYPLNAHRKELADAEGAREREKELAKEIQDGDLDGDDGMGDF